MTEIERVDEPQTVDDHLTAIETVDARTRAGRAAHHHAQLAKWALDTERREHAAAVRAITKARDDAQQDAKAVVQEYRDKIVALTPDYTEGHPAKIESPMLVDDGGRRSSNRHRSFTLHEVEEALIRFRVAGAGDLAPMAFEDTYRGQSITCHVRDELMEAREQRDARRAREAHDRAARRYQLVAAAVVVPPAALLVLAGLKWTYLLLIGWVI